MGCKYYSLRQPSTFGEATTGFLAKSGAKATTFLSDERQQEVAFLQSWGVIMIKF